MTVDFQSLEDHQATIRDRDSMAQIRVPMAELKQLLLAKIGGETFGTQQLWSSTAKDAGQTTSPDMT